MFALQGDSSNDRNFYGPVLQNPRLGWGEPYTPSPLSPGMPLPSDPFTDSAPAPLQRYQFHQGAYMQDNQQMMALQDRCKALEIQVVKLTTERDAFQSIFQQLASALQQSGNPLTFDPTFPAQLGSNDANRPTPQTHPKVRFWNQIDYIEWLDTFMGRLSDRGKLGYLEHENGGSIPATMVKGIQKALHAGWCELTNRKLAPKTWGVLSASGRKLIHTLMEDAYPLLKFANDGWKLEYLASTSYSAWRRTYLTDNGNWKLKNHGNEDEDESDDGNAGDSQTLSLKGKKCKKAKFSIKSKVPQKKMKADSESADTILPWISTTNTPSSSTSIANPLAALALAASQVQLPPLPLEPASSPLPSAPNGANSEANTQNRAGLPTTDNANASKATTGSTKISTKGKMRPSSTKNGRNLCAQRWLKTLKTNGTTEEFCAYYGDLTPGSTKDVHALICLVRQAYDDESASLVANNSWNKITYDGTIY
ncbi:uncharacterized protein EDB91DRAFT_1080562 [Suillus paluster]|uniref:uncharacterized protein n=1 Tax=Suillus paluster TaxID=48578 RepID=UPI001B8855AA|nr:uncharacterized protein EDB91DRAFT_1080562 [Suillus paluster]KAG1745054.1 hypothetical protein EDB91DRAFT_1080562 [Suillus paluster]